MSQAIRTINIRGKQYVDVAERVRLCHADEGFTMTDQRTYELAGRYFMSITIEVKGKRYIGDAEIKFDAPRHTPDGSNPVECCQTSALGRALGFAGYGSLESIASADEVLLALSHQDTLPPHARSNGQQQERVADMHPTQKNGVAPSGRESGPSARLNALYQKAQEAGAIEKGLGKHEGAAAFLTWAGEVLSANVANVGQLTASRIEALETFLITKEAA